MSLGEDTHTWHPAAAAAAAASTSDTPQKVEAAAEDTFGSTQTHGERFVVALDAAGRRRWPHMDDSSLLLLCRGVGGKTRGPGAE